MNKRENIKYDKQQAIVAEMQDTSASIIHASINDERARQHFDQHFYGGSGEVYFVHHSHAHRNGRG